MQLSLVRELCDAGASPDLSGRQGEGTPLLWACGDVSEGGGPTSEVVKVLVEHGADPGVAVNPAEGVPLTGTTPLATGESSSRSQHPNRNRLSVARTEHSINQCTIGLTSGPFIYSEFSVPNPFLTPT